MIQYDDLINESGILSSLKRLEAANDKFADSVVNQNERARKSLVDLTGQLAATREQILSLDNNQKNGKATSQIGGMKDDVRKITDAYKEQQSVLERNQKLLDLNTASVDSMRKRIKDLKTEYDSLDRSEESNINRMKAIEAEMRRTAQATNALTKLTNDAARSNKAAEGSYNALDNELKQMRATLRGMPNAFDASTGEINKQNKAAVELAAKIDRANASLVKMDKIQGNFQRNVGNYPKGGFLGSFVGELSGPATQLLTGAGLAAGIIRMGAAVVSVRSEYELLERQLETTLGSKGVAAEAQKIITGFANKTPGEIADVTKAFNRLVDIGIAPTEKELFQLSDVAISKGKTIEQYVELIADAQQGQFDRLAEFSINAKKNGDSVDFTFRGVTTTVQNTTTEINKYLLSLGDLPGIAGQTEQAGKTLAGQWSTIKDTFRGIANEIGESLQPALQWLLTTTQQAADGLSGYIKDLRAVAAEKEKAGKAGGVGTFFQSIFNPHQFAIDATEAEIAANEREIERQKKAKANGKTGQSETYADFRKQLEERNKRADEIRKKRLADDKANKEADKKLAESLRKSQSVTGERLANLDSQRQDGLITEQQFIEDRLKITLDGLTNRQALLEKAGKKETDDYINIQKEKKKADTEYGRSQLQLDLKSNKGKTDASLSGLDKQRSEGDISDLSYIDKRHELIVAGIERDRQTLRDAGQAQTELFKATDTALQSEQSDYLDKRLQAIKKSFKDELGVIGDSLKTIDQQAGADYETRLAESRVFYNSLRQQVEEAEANGRISPTDARNSIQLIDINETKAELTIFQQIIEQSKTLTHSFIDDRIEQLKNYIAFSNGSEKELFEYKKEIADLEKLREKSDADDAIALQKKVADNDIAVTDKVHQNKKQKSAEEKQMARDVLNTAIQGGASLVNALFESGQQGIATQQADLEKRQAFELSLVGDSEAAKAAIQQKYQAEKNALAHKADVAAKESALFNIAIAGAQGVLSALASIPPNVPLSILIGGLALANAAIVASRPLPAYFAGKNIDGISTDNYSGPAIAGDRGRELWHHDGQTELVNKPSVINVGRDDIIYPNHITERLLRGEYAEGKQIMARTGRSSQLSANLSRSRDSYQANQLALALGRNTTPSAAAIGKAVAQALENNPKYSLSWDKNGFNIHEHDAHNRRLIQRNKHQLGKKG